MQLPHAATGRRTAELILDELQHLEANGGVVLLRHSAREYVKGRHDLLNPLTEAGRELAASLGRAIPAGLTLHGYASPAERCVDTAEQLLAGYAAGGGSVGRTRPMEGLGVFYVLDQRKFFRALQAAGSLRVLVSDWVAGKLAPDVMIPATTAVMTLLQALRSRLARAPENVDGARVDLCVSHDLTLQVVRSVLFGIDAQEDQEVEFLDALVLSGTAAATRIATHDRTLQLD